MPDEKFIDYFIDQSESVEPGVSEYWIVNDDGQANFVYVKSALARPVGWSKDNFSALTRAANGFQQIVLHSLFQKDIDKFVLSLKGSIPVVWIFWGGDGYAFTCNIRRWYLPITWHQRVQAFKENESYFYIFPRLVERVRLYRSSRRLRRLIRRINFCATWVKYDFDMIKHLSPEMTWFSYSYFSHTQMGLDSIASNVLNPNKLWLGNSASDTNNHFDALSYLNEIGWSGSIITPLSYGDREYATRVINYGKEMFGDRFSPILEYLPIDEYHQLMNSCGFVWMNHIRQQAAGNALAALYMGKAVIMNGKNNLYKTFRDWGIRFADLSMLSETGPLNFSEFCANQAILKLHLSSDEVVKSIKTLYRVALHES